jgi:hypothetical protein
LFNTDETDKAAKLGLGLPVLVRDDGAMSKDAKNWVGGKIVSKTIAGIESGNDAEHRDESDESRGLDDGGAKEARTLRKSRAVS